MIWHENLLVLSGIGDRVHQLVLLLIVQISCFIVHSWHKLSC